MLAGAARTYVDRYAVQPGTRAVVLANNDSAYSAALALHRAGVNVRAIIDAYEGLAQVRSQDSDRGEIEIVIPESLTREAEPVLAQLCLAVSFWQAGSTRTRPGPGGGWPGGTRSWIPATAWGCAPRH